MSALSYRATNGNGGNTTFSIDTFSEDEIKVYVNEVLKTKGSSNDYIISNYTATGGRIDWVGTPPSSSDRIRIVRQTKILNNGGNAVEGKATYSAGAAVKATDLNNNTKQALRSLQEQNDQLIQTYDIQDDAITGPKIADGTIVTGNLANSSVTQDKLANNSVGTPELINGSVNSDKILDGTIVNADVNASAAIAGTKINPNFGSQTISTTGTAVTGALGVVGDIDLTGNVDGRDVAADGTKLDTIETNAKDDQTAAEIKTLLQANKLTTNEIADDAVTIDKIADAAIVTNSEQSGHTVNDNTFFTTAAAEARYFNASTGETIKDGQTFPDDDNTIATTAAINDRIIDLIDDVGGFDIIQSEQHFPDTNPQGTTGQAAVLSVKAATTNLVPSGTTVTISNGNLANNADITITGVTSTIPTGFGFLVESTTTTHEYSFHRLVPKATEVTTIASNISNINAAANNESNINAAVSNASNINAAVANASNINAVASNASNINAAVSNASNINAAVSNATNINTTASNIANVNNVGTNIAKVNSVAAVVGGTQTFVVTVSGGVFYIDGQSNPVLTLARGFTYTFDVSDSSNSGHPLRFKDGSGNSYTTGVTTSGTEGSSGATVVIAVAANAPSSLRYYCTVHGNGMGNTITVTDDNIGIVAGSIANVNTTAASISNVNTTAGSISNVNTVASNINSVNSFFNTYRIGANNPTTSLDTGDLFFNTTSNSLKVYTGSAWVDGVTATGNFAVVTGNTFTGTNNHNDNVKSIYGNSNDLQIYHDGGTNSYLMNNTGTLRIRGNDIRLQNINGETYTKHLSDGAVFLAYDNATKFETTSFGNKFTGNIAFNRPNDTVGDSSAGQSSTATPNRFVFNNHFSNGYTDASLKLYLFNHGVTRHGFTSGPNFDIQYHSSGSDSASRHDFYVQNTKSLAIYKDRVKLSDNKTLQFGNGNDLEILHDGGHSRIRDVGDGSLLLETNGSSIQLNKGSSENMLVATPDGSVDLYHDGTKRFETTSAGVSVTGNIAVSGTVDGVDIAALNTTVSNITTDLVSDTSPELGATLETNGYSIHFNDSTSTIGFRNRIRMGDDEDLQIFHDGTNSYVSEGGTGNLKLRSNGTAVQIEKSDGESMAVFRTDGAVELYHNGSKKFETSSSGVTTDGLMNFNGTGDKILIGDAGKIAFGGGLDLTIQSDGTNGVITVPQASGYLQLNNEGGNIYLDAQRGTSTIYLRSGNGTDGLHNSIICNGNGDVDLYYQNSLKASTTSNGFQVNSTLHINGGAISRSDHHVGHLVGTYNNVGANSYNTNPIYTIGSNYNPASTSLSNMYGVGFTHGNASFTPSGADWGLYVAGNGTSRIFLDGGNGRIYYGTNNRYLSESSGSYGTIQVNGNGTNGYEGYNIDGRYVLMHDGGDNGGLYNDVDDEWHIYTARNAGTYLYYNGSHKLDTTTYGVQVIGTLHLNNTSTALSEGGGDAVRISTTTGYVDIGSMNTSYCHLQTDRGAFYMNTQLQIAGSVVPYGTSGTYNLGQSNARWANIYTNDLHLSNEGSSNDVDGTWGDWTIQEGESDLFLKNNRSGKKYKFNLMEVS